jgi:hypothetical protein
MASFELITEQRAPKGPATASALSRRMREYEGFVTAVKRGQTGKLVPSDGETAASVRLRVARAARRVGKPIQTWTVEDTVYFKPF